MLATLSATWEHELAQIDCQGATFNYSSLIWGLIISLVIGRWLGVLNSVIPCLYPLSVTPSLALQ